MTVMLYQCLFTLRGPEELFGKLWMGSAAAFFVYVGAHLLWRCVPCKRPI